MKTKGFREDFSWKGFRFGLYGGIKFRRSGLYGGDKVEIYSILISILKLKKKKLIVGQIQKRLWKWHGCWCVSMWA